MAANASSPLRRVVAASPISKSAACDLPRSYKLSVPHPHSQIHPPGQCPQRSLGLPCQRTFPFEEATFPRSMILCPTLVSAFLGFILGTIYCAWQHLNHSRMGHARALLYFFESPLGAKKWKDDVVSEDFGFPAALLVIEKGERVRLNKDLFHLSSQRLRHTPASKPWTNALLQQVHDRSIQFIEHLLSSAPGRDFDVARPAWERLAAALKSEGEVQIQRHFKRDGSDSGVWFCRVLS